MDAFYSLLPQRIKLLRRLHGLSQYELAERIGATREAVYQWERGMKPTSMYYLLRLARVFDVSVTAFFPAVDEWHPAVSESVCASFAFSRPCQDPARQGQRRRA